ncbi:hypothetical protein [Salinispora arenicola]|uniref:hypothetical protein n=1 Tax=Salinispora arenicola TaxID=168697 RepID=UPI00169F63F0|nr:hypothetical protein [Salinispora arenicola]NIL60844.1 hypothetical protein [Salinispora arenicola]
MRLSLDADDSSTVGTRFLVESVAVFAELGCVSVGSVGGGGSASDFDDSSTVGARFLVESVAGLAQQDLAFLVRTVDSEIHIRHLKQFRAAAAAAPLLVRVLLTQQNVTDPMRCVLAALFGLALHGIPFR